MYFCLYYGAWYNHSCTWWAPQSAEPQALHLGLPRAGKNEWVLKEYLLDELAEYVQDDGMTNLSQSEGCKNILLDWQKAPPKASGTIKEQHDCQWQESPHLGEISACSRGK